MIQLQFLTTKTKKLFAKGKTFLPSDKDVYVAVPINTGRDYKENNHEETTRDRWYKHRKGVLRKELQGLWLGFELGLGPGPPNQKLD